MPENRHDPSTWSPGQVAYDQALREGPTAALDQFCSLFRASSTSETRDIEQIFSLSVVLSENLDKLTYPRTATPNEDLWRALLESDFMVFVARTISEPDFLTYRMDLVFNVCDLLKSMLQVWWMWIVPKGSSDYRETIQTVPPDPYDACWDATDSIEKIGMAILVCFDDIAYLMRDIQMRISTPTLPYLAMFSFVSCCWITLYSSAQFEANKKLPSNHHALILIHELCAASRVTENENSSLPWSRQFMAAIVEAMGARSLVRAAYNALSYSEHLVDRHLTACLDILEIQMELIGVHWYASPPLLDAFMHAMHREDHDPDPEDGPGVLTRRRLKAYEGVFRHLEKMLPGLESGAIPLGSFSCTTFWNLLSGGVHPASDADGVLRHESGDCLCGDHTALNEAMLTMAARFSALKDAYLSALRHKRLPQPVVNQIRRTGAPQGAGPTGRWYFVVSLLRERLRHEASSVNSTLLNAWLELGGAFGMDEVSQRDLKAAHVARQCCWRPCKYHSTPSEKPLLVCKGCKEARYCSAACQRSDWKQGNHRVQCRRVK
ncbi:unnamed protein product [Peniophora sp. CBMAI 1063]|nr:unnamed protein product [Peniophora sp. CBMAI 1063]